MMNDDFIICDIALDGFQVVKSQYFSRQLEPAMTIWETSVSFNAYAYASMNNCEAIQLLINYNKRCIVVKPVSSREPEAIIWKRSASKPNYKKLECSAFARRLFETWGLDKSYRYRTTGRVVQCDKKIMLLFDFSSPEVWKGTKLVREHG